MGASWMECSTGLPSLQGRKKGRSALGEGGTGAQELCASVNLKSQRQRKENVSRLRQWLTVSNAAKSFISAHRSDLWIWVGEGYLYLEQCP